MKKIQKILEEHKIKPTFERLSILEYLTVLGEHPAATGIFKAMREKIPTISKTTVYNTLKILLKKGIICSFSVPGREDHYDLNTDSHYHLYCKVCHQIYNLELDCPVLNKGTIEGHKVENFNGYFTGVCERCLKKKK